MTAKKTHEELVELLQTGKIGFLRFVMDGDNAEDYLEWCQTHGTDPSDAPPIQPFFQSEAFICSMRAIINVVHLFMSVSFIFT